MKTSKQINTLLTHNYCISVFKGALLQNNCIDCPMNYNKAFSPSTRMLIISKNTLKTEIQHNLCVFIDFKEQSCSYLQNIKIISNKFVLP